MDVREFCLKNTNVGELIVIRDNGWIVHTVWIDIEDIFMISPKIANKIVRSDSWDELSITTQHGDKISVPCHYIDV